MRDRQASDFTAPNGKEPKFVAGPFQPPAAPQDAAAPIRAELERLRTELLASKSAAEQAQLIAEENARARQSADEKRARKERWMDRLIGDLDREFPGIAGAVVQREMLTAETMHQYLNTPGGAVYGFAPQGSPAEAFAFTPRTHIADLWLASAFTFGGGFSGAMMGGAEAAHAAVKAAQ